MGAFAATALVTALFVRNGLAIPLTSGNSGGQVDPQITIVSPKGKATGRWGHM
jgi:hypothetical protein